MLKYIIRLRYVIVIIVLIIILSSSFVSVYGADSTYRMLHGDEFQDSLIIGKITNVNANKLTVDVIRQVDGGICSSIVSISNEEIKQRNLDFQVNDIILGSIKFTDLLHINCKIIYGLYKVKLMNDNKIEMDITTADIGFIEWYVNTGGDDVCATNTSYYLNPNGDGNNTQLLFSDGKWYFNSLDTKYKAPVSGIVYNPFIVFVVFVILLVTVILIKIHKKKRKILQNS